MFFRVLLQLLQEELVGLQRHRNTTTLSDPLPEQLNLRTHISTKDAEGETPG